MRGEWHVNNDGEVKRCYADVKCKFDGNAQHAKTKAEALINAEKFNQEHAKNHFAVTSAIPADPATEITLNDDPHIPEDLKKSVEENDSNISPAQQHALDRMKEIEKARNKRLTETANMTDYEKDNSGFFSDDEAKDYLLEEYPYLFMDDDYMYYAEFFKDPREIDDPDYADSDDWYDDETLSVGNIKLGHDNEDMERTYAAIDARIDSGDYQDVPLKNLVKVKFPFDNVYASQDNLDANAVAKYVRNINAESFNGAKPLLVKYDDNYFIVDGHHRLAAAGITEQDVEVRLVDFDKKS